MVEDEDLRFHDDPELLWVALGQVLERPAWHADAACREHPELSWFPERGQPVDAAPGGLPGLSGAGGVRRRRRG